MERELGAAHGAAEGADPRHAPAGGVGRQAPGRPARCPAVRPRPRAGPGPRTQASPGHPRRRFCPDLGKPATPGPRNRLFSIRGVLRFPEGAPASIPATREYLEELRAIPLVQSQGDGVRSFIGVMLALIAARYPVVLIDEPEVLPPPPTQARLLGRKLGALTP